MAFLSISANFSFVVILVLASGTQGNYQQYNPNPGNTGIQNTVDDLWVDLVANFDHRTGTTKDPWADPDPRTGTTKDPWAQTTVDPWIRNNGNSINNDYSSTPSIGLHDSADVINTINVISGAYVNNQHNTANGNKDSSSNTAIGYYNNTGRNLATGSTANCQAAIQQCSLFDVDASSLDDVYQQAFVTMLKKQRLQFQANLVKARDHFINLFNQVILNPESASILGSSSSCSNATVRPVYMLNDPTNSLPPPESVDDVTVTPLQACVVSQWSEWSIVGFGVLERKKTIVRPGKCCPDDLVQRVDISNYLNGNNSIFENPGHVAENFDKDFLTTDPRDILLVIDTSSSIFTTDFQLMKEGIKTMIDLFCGGFGSNVTSNNRLAILQFSTQTYIHYRFSDPQTPEALKDAVDRMQDFGGKTCTGDALLVAYNEIFVTSRGARPNVPQDTLVITDGHANCGADIVSAAQKLQERSKSVYALGIGISSDIMAKNQVKSMVSNSDDHHIFSLARYINFKEMIDYIKYHQNGQRCIPIVTKTQNQGK